MDEQWLNQRKYPMENLFISGEVHTYKKGKSPNQRTEKLSFVAERFFFIEGTVPQREGKSIGEKRIQEKSFMWEGELGPTLENNKDRQDKCLDPNS